MWTAGTSASSSISLLTAIRNIGPACGEAGAPTMVLTSVTRPAAGARSDIGAGGRRAGLRGGGVSRASSWLSVTVSPSRTRRSVTLKSFLIDPDHRLAARHDESGYPHHVGEAGVGGFRDDRPARCRVSLRLRTRTMLEPVPPDRPAPRTQRPNAGLRYRESIIAGSIQTWVAPRDCLIAPGLLVEAAFGLHSNYLSARRNQRIPWRYSDPWPWRWRCPRRLRRSRHCVSWRGRVRTATMSISD